MKKAFTLIEILISVSIMLLIIAVVVPPLTKNRQDKLLLQSTDDVVSLLNKARSDTLSSVNGEAYGIKFENDRVIFFTGPTYDASATSNKITYLQNGITIPLGSLVLNGSATNVLFNRLTGATNQYGTIQIQVTNDASKSKIITVSKTGIVTSN